MTHFQLNRRLLLRSAAGAAGAGLLWPMRTFAQACLTTSSDTLGPYFVAGAPARGSIAGPDEPGDALVVRGHILGPDCRTPLGRASLNVWQADANGLYHFKDENFRLRGQLLTDDDGSFLFKTVVPGRYKVDEGYRPAHIHLIVSHPRHQELTTQLYFKGDPYLGTKDGCGDECDSKDVDRIVDLKKAETGRGFTADLKIVLRARRG